MARCANSECITILRNGKKEGDLCDTCERNGKEPLITFPSDISPKIMSGRKKGPGFYVSFSREQGGVVF